MKQGYFLMVPNFRFNLQMEVKHVNLLQDQERVELLGSNFSGVFSPGITNSEFDYLSTIFNFIFSSVRQLKDLYAYLVIEANSRTGVSSILCFSRQCNWNERNS